MRPDGTRVRDLTAIMQALPYVMPKRYDAQNWAEENLDEDAIRDYIRAKRREGRAPAPPFSRPRPPAGRWFAGVWAHPPDAAGPADHCFRAAGPAAFSGPRRPAQCQPHR